MKQFKKISALMTALAICSTMSMIPVSAEESADLPDWIPQNFAEAMQFDNQYGRTHIEDGLICCVRDERTWTYDYSYATETTGSPMKTLLHETYTLTLPEKPDQSDKEAYAEYLRQLEELGIPEFYADYPEEINTSIQYEVTVYQPEETGSIGINWLTVWDDEQKEPRIDTPLTFEVSDNGEITETDFYGWLPDCITEYSAFRKQYGTTSVHDQYIVFCDDIAGDGGYSLFWNQEGTAEVEEVLDYFVSSTELILISGGTYHEIAVYTPVTSGTVEMTWTERREWEPEEDFIEQTVKNYQVDEDGTIHEIEPVSIMGDVNADGEFSVLDVILFQKWLLNIPDTHLENWKNADFTEDNQLNVFDLALMKQALIQKNQEQVDYSIAEQKSYMRKNIGQHEEAEAYIAHTFDEFLEIVESAEGEIDENSVPDGLDEAFFEDKAVIVMYTTARSSETFTLINDIQHQQNKFIISSEIIMPLVPLPDMSYNRNIIIVDQADVQDITSIEFKETLRTYDSFNVEETESVFDYVRNWTMRNISPINGDM